MAKQAELLEGQMLSVKSDMLELLRDLATYETLACQAVNTTDGLIRINHLASSLPEISDSFAEMSENEQRIYASLRAGLDDMKTEAETAESAERLGIWEDFGSRPEVDLSRGLVFKGASRISGIPVLYRVLGAAHSAVFQVNVQTLAGDSFSLKVTALGKADFESKAMKQFLLERLYFVVKSHSLQLCYNELHSTQFMTVVIELKGLSHFVSSVFISSHDDEVVLQLPDGHSRVSVHRSKVADRTSVFRTKPERLVRKLEKHLYYNEDLGVLEWVTEEDFLYKSRELDSKYLDEHYIASTTEHHIFLPLFKGSLQIRGHQFTILVLVSQARLKLDVTYEDFTRSVHSQSPLMKLLTGLQFKNLNVELSTLMSSLELELVVLKMFKHKLTA
jgi:hypothetical protein